MSIYIDILLCTHLNVAVTHLSLFRKNLVRILAGLLVILHEVLSGFPQSVQSNVG
jgi:hypothetical protein